MAYITSRMLACLRAACACICVFVCERRMFYTMLLQITFSTPRHRATDSPDLLMTDSGSKRTHSIRTAARTSFHTHVWHNYTHFLLLLCVVKFRTNQSQYWRLAGHTHTHANGEWKHSRDMFDNFIVPVGWHFHPAAFCANFRRENVNKNPNHRPVVPRSSPRATCAHCMCALDH